VKVFLSTDIEGCAGIVDWAQVVSGTSEYELGRRLLLAEVNAAIDGAVDAGAHELLVNDSHWTMQNLPPDALHARARYLSGQHKPLYMMEGLDASFDAAFFVAYHGSIGAERAVLSHTYNPRVIGHVSINGVTVGESGLNALVAQHFGVPVALVTGDDVTAEETRAVLPGAEAVVVKRAVSRFAADSLHPEAACELIRTGARRALERAAEIGPPRFDLPARAEVTFLTADMADMAAWIRGVERLDARRVAIEDDDTLRLYRTFVTVVFLTRGLPEP
jgi:D-amino peptidase